MNDIFKKVNFPFKIRNKMVEESWVWKKKIELNEICKEPVETQ